MSIVFISEYINNKINFVIESTGVPQLTAPKVAEYYIPLPRFPSNNALPKYSHKLTKQLKKNNNIKKNYKK